MPPKLQLQKLPGKGDGGWGKMCLRRFLADQKIASSWRERQKKKKEKKKKKKGEEEKKKKKKKKKRFAALTARATSYFLLPDTF